MPRAGGVRPAVSLALLQGCSLQPDLWAPTMALSPVPSGAAGASPSMNLRRTPSPQAPRCPWVPQAHSEPCPPSLDLLLPCVRAGPGPGAGGKKGNESTEGSGRSQAAEPVQDRKSQGGEAGSGRWAGLGSRTSGAPREEPWAPCPLAGRTPEARGNCRAAPSNHPPPLPAASRLPLWGRAPPEQQVKACGVAMLPGAGGARVTSHSCSHSSHGLGLRQR